MSFSLVLFFKYFRWSCLLLFLDENYCLFPKTLVCNKPTETSFISFPMPKASVAKMAPMKGTRGLHPALYVVGSGQGDSFQRMDSEQKQPESVPGQRSYSLGHRSLPSWHLRSHVWHGSVTPRRSPEAQGQSWPTAGFAWRRNKHLFLKPPRLQSVFVIVYPTRLLPSPALTPEMPSWTPCTYSYPHPLHRQALSLPPLSLTKPQTDGLGTRVFHLCRVARMSPPGTNDDSVRQPSPLCAFPASLPCIHPPPRRLVPGWELWASSVRGATRDTPRDWGSSEGGAGVSFPWYSAKWRQNPESGEITRAYFDDGFACHILAYNSEGVRVIDRSCDNKTPFVSIYIFLRMSFLSPYIAKDKNWHSMGVKLCLLLSDK